MKITRIFTILVLCASLIFLLAPTDSIQASGAFTGPTNLKVTYYPPDSLKFSWKNNDPYPFYDLYYTKQCPGQGGLTYKIQIGGTKTSYTIKMPNGCLISFTLKVCPFIDQCTTWGTGKISIPPVPPTNLTVTTSGSGTSTKYNTKWKDNSNNEGINVIAIGYAGGIKVFGYSANTTTAAIPASAIPASAKYEFIAGAIPASAIPASFKKSGDAIPASTLNVLTIPMDGLKYFSSNVYLPLIISSNLVKISK